MKQVFIKYNPYKLETEVMVDGKPLAQNSRLMDKIGSEARLQDWVEELPDILLEEYNDTDFEVAFHGTLMDYEDLTAVFTAAYEQKGITCVLDRIPAKETSDKEALLDEVFQEIQRGPFEELRDAEIEAAFKQAKSNEFEVCIVATMSAGKSTLMNALLGKKLMPSKQEACTAIITRIKDDIKTDNDKVWRAEVFKKGQDLQKDNPIQIYEELDYETMVRLNEDENVSDIKISGKIPFVTSDEVSLVLIDTPGPNNARNLEHRNTQKRFLSQSSKSLVLYIMEPTFGNDDDNNLLEDIANSMSVGGKQSKDRFIFVVNKMDDRRGEDGKVEETLGRICSYLEDHGIKNPNLFPASALTALDIRRIANGDEVDEDTLDETEVKVRKLNRHSNLYLESYATLPNSIKSNIQDRLAKAEEAGDVSSKALIHTGVISIEAAIRQYVQKYAKTAKIKNIVNTFQHKLDEVGAFEETKRKIAENQEEHDKIVKQIEAIRQKINDVKSAQEFKAKVEATVTRVDDESKNAIEDIVGEFQRRITKRIDAIRGEELDINDAEEAVERLERFAKKLEPDFQEKLNELIRDSLIETGKKLLEEYKEKLRSLKEDSISIEEGITIDPFKLMVGSVVSSDDFSVERFIHNKKVKDGEEWVENTDRKWYKPWTWFQEKGYYRTKYKTVKYVKGEEIAVNFLMPAQDSLWENGENAKKYAYQQSKHIAEKFKKEFERLDGLLEDKMRVLEGCAEDRNNAEKNIQESKNKLRWLEDIKDKVEKILEI